MLWLCQEHFLLSAFYLTHSYKNLGAKWKYLVSISGEETWANRAYFSM